MRYEGWDAHDLRDHLLQTERELAEAQRERDVVNLQEIDRCLAAERREWNVKYQRQQADIDRLRRELAEARQLLKPCECCGASLTRVEAGRATCWQGCSYPAETTY